MPASGYAITISAVDHATKTLDQVNRQMAAIRAPVDRVTKSIAKFSDVSGLKAVAKGFTEVTRSTWGVFQNVSRIVDPLGIITGAGTIAGIAALEARFASFGQTLSNTSKLMNIDPAKLALWENAGKLVGVAPGETDSSLRSLQKIATDARFGQNNKASGLLTQILGPNWQKESQDLPGTVMKISQYLGKLHGSARAGAVSNIEGILGLGDNFTSELLRGPAALQQNLSKAKDLGSPSDAQIAAGDGLAQSLNAARESVENLGTSIASDLAPYVTKMLNSFNGWIVANRTLINQDIATVVTGVTSAIAHFDWNGFAGSVKNILDTVNSIVQATGGWSVALEGLFALMAANFAINILTPFATLLLTIGKISAALFDLTSVSFPALIAGADVVAAALAAAGIVDMVQHASTASGDNFDVTNAQMGKQTPAGIKKNANVLRTVMRSHGMPDASIAGFFGNFIGESTIDPSNQQPDGPGYGIAQWDKARQAQFKQVEGVDIHGSKMAQQVDFVWWELNQPKYRPLLNALMSGKLSVSQATLAIDQGYEKPKNLFDPGSGIMKRSLYANAYYNGLQQPDAPPVASPSHQIIIPPAAPALALQSGPGRAPSTEQEDRHSVIDINIQSDGSKVSAREKKAGQMVKTNLKVQSPMPSAGP